MIRPNIDPCSVFVPDMFEDNDDCSTAVALGDGLYTGLTVFDADNDYLAIGLDAGATLVANIFFVDAQADVDIYLWDPAIACDTNVVGTNGSGGGFGSNYCAANANSTGVPGTISGAGSRMVADNNVTLTASDLPRFSFGFFIVSKMPGFAPNPGGSSGNLCVSGSVGRYVGSGQVMNSGTAGEIVLPLDLTNTPQPTGAVSIASGETWNFQLWHRDLDSGGNPTSNFTDGLEVMFL